MRLILILLILSTAFASCDAQRKPAVVASSGTTPDTTHVQRTDEEWKKVLTPQQYRVLRLKDTDRPFTGKYYRTTDEGVYHCAGCGAELFTSDMKFDSDCGWPSFDRAMEGGKIKTEIDRSYGMVRTEILCAACGGHLGHLFEDGPTDTGLRYCVNSTSLNFVRTK